MREFEAHFLEIDVVETEKKLAALGAVKISDSLLKEIIFDKPDRSWNPIQKRVRIRADGKKVDLAYKEQIAYNTMGGTEEYEFEVSDLDAAKAFVEKLGLIPIREQEKKRIRYKLGDMVFDIDSWPKIPPYLEIESDSEIKVKAAAEKLGLDWSKACFLDAKQIYEDVYNIKPLDDVYLLTF
ncbi:MAG: class IV adenylate cyclase, partial [Candidatus Doudnabacteria bacterium]|nr:class IV adenylate cyclase [Candidatus Doudnabacteria bacterium]